jgi:hypothetical protein
MREPPVAPHSGSGAKVLAERSSFRGAFVAPLPQLENVMSRRTWSTGISLLLVFTALIGSEARAQSAVTYDGVAAREVRHLLSRVEGWKVPSCATCTDGVTPSIRMNKNSQRDAYVAAAVTYAWAAEAYHRLGNAAKAKESAEGAKKSLEQANELCSGSPSNSGGGSGPQTLTIWSCPAPF